MRFSSIDTVSFTNRNGDTVPIKYIRDLYDGTISKEIKIKSSDELDEIASREDIYGDDTEGESYKIFDVNAVRLVESKFDLSNIKKLGIPS